MKYGGSLPAELAEQIATKYHVGIMDVIGSPLTENPMAAYWTLTLPNGIKVARSAPATSSTRARARSTHNTR